MALDANNLSVSERLAAPTPPFFKVLRHIGLILATVSAVAASLASGGVTLPIWIISGAKIAAAVGATLATTSQLAVDEKAANDPTTPNPIN